MQKEKESKELRRMIIANVILQIVTIFGVLSKGEGNFEAMRTGTAISLAIYWPGVVWILLKRENRLNKIDKVFIYVGYWILGCFFIPMISILLKQM